MSRADEIEVYRDDSDEWRWRKVAPNGEIVADSAEGYSRKSDAIEAAHRELNTVALVVVEPEP